MYKFLRHTALDVKTIMKGSGTMTFKKAAHGPTLQNLPVPFTLITCVMCNPCITYVLTKRK